MRAPRRRRPVARWAAAAPLVAALVAAGVLSVPLAATAQAPPEGERRQEDGVPAPDEPRSPGIELPEGEGRALVQTGCMPCHDLAGIAAFKGYWNREQWAAMVATMIGHGAQLDAAQAETVTDYLAAHFGVEEDLRQKRGTTE